jgi:hypothetical protein
MNDDVAETGTADKRIRGILHAKIVRQNARLLEQTHHSGANRSRPRVGAQGTGPSLAHPIPVCSVPVFWSHIPFI